jgi:DNA polymerase-3 subunit epsilon
MNNFPVIVLDFETTGLSPQYGDRAIEIGAVLIENNMVTDRFQSLMRLKIEGRTEGKTEASMSLCFSESSRGDIPK